MYLGTNDVKVYLGSVKIYPTEEPPTPQYQDFCKLSLNNGDVIELEGSGELTQSMISNYKSTLVSAEIKTLCTSIGSGAFYQCSSLTSVSIGDNVTSIGNQAFEFCSSLTSIDIPNSVTSIGTSAFASCSGLTSVTIPNGVTSISSGTFSACRGLTSVTIPNSVTSISASAFSDCRSLTNITIPNSVTSIGIFVFQSCTSLTSVTVNATTPPTLDSSVFYNTNKNLVIYVPSESVDAYKAASGWSDYASRIRAIPT